MVKKPRLFIALCTLPALILTIVFMIVPMVNAIYLSFTSSTALSVGFNSKFVFLDNYRYMVTAGITSISLRVLNSA